MKRRHVLATGAAAALTPRLASPMSPKFTVPAEDAPHARTFMMWPVSRAVYGRGAFLDEAQRTIADLASAIANFEPVTMLAHRDDHPAARRRLSGGVSLWDVPTEDLWARDAGTVFATDGATLEVVDIRFNGWGGKQTHRRDAQVARRVAERLGLPLRRTGLVGEAGGVEQDGHGLLLAHESSWVNPNRNPGLSRDRITQRLAEAYGATSVIWSRGVYGQDITDYHIDSLARFTAPGRVLANMPARPDPRDPFHAAAQQTLAAIRSAGLALEVIDEPDYPRITAPDFVASYANFYVANGAVFASRFGDRGADERARDALGRHFPGREIVMLDTDALGELGGGIHCATQQMPAL